MVSVELSNGIAEVLDILNHTKKEDVDKISPRFMSFLRENCSKTYKPNLDHTKRIKDMKLRESTIGILSIIYTKFWCSKQQAIEFNKKLEENEIKYQEELRKKYNPDNLFKKNKEINNENLPVKLDEKQNIFTKFINFIKNFFKRN